MLSAPDGFADRLSRTCPGTSLVWKSYEDGVALVMPVVGHFFRRWKATDGTIWHQAESGYGEGVKLPHHAAPLARIVGRWQVCETGIRSGGSYVIFDAVNADGSPHAHNDALIEAVKKREVGRFSPKWAGEAEAAFRSGRFKERTSSLADAAHEAAGHWFEKVKGINHHFIGATQQAEKEFQLRITDRRTSTRMVQDASNDGNNACAHP